MSENKNITKKTNDMDLFLGHIYDQLDTWACEYGNAAHVEDEPLTVMAKATPDLQNTYDNYALYDTPVEDEGDGEDTAMDFLVVFDRLTDDQKDYFITLKDGRESLLILPALGELYHVSPDGTYKKHAMSEGFESDTFYGLHLEFMEWIAEDTAPDTGASSADSNGSGLVAVQVTS